MHHEFSKVGAKLAKNNKYYLTVVWDPVQEAWLTFHHPTRGDDADQRLLTKKVLAHFDARR